MLKTSLVIAGWFGVGIVVLVSALNASAAEKVVICVDAEMKTALEEAAKNAKSANLPRVGPLARVAGDAEVGLLFKLFGSHSIELLVGEPDAVKGDPAFILSLLPQKTVPGRSAFVESTTTRTPGFIRTTNVLKEVVGVVPLKLVLTAKEEPKPILSETVPVPLIRRLELGAGGPLELLRKEALAAAGKDVGTVLESQLVGALVKRPKPFLVANQVKIKATFANTLPVRMRGTAEFQVGDWKAQQEFDLAPGENKNFDVAIGTPLAGRINTRQVIAAVAKALRVTSAGLQLGEDGSK